jgi:hypothetical protein
LYVEIKIAGKPLALAALPEISLGPMVGHCLLLLCHLGPNSQIDSLVTDLTGSWQNTLSSSASELFTSTVERERD